MSSVASSPQIHGPGERRGGVRVGGVRPSTHGPPSSSSSSSRTCRRSGGGGGRHTPPFLLLFFSDCRRSRLPAAAVPFPLPLRSIWRGEAAAGGGADLPSAAVEGDREVADGCGATPFDNFCLFFYDVNLQCKSVLWIRIRRSCVHVWRIVLINEL